MACLSRDEIVGYGSMETEPRGANERLRRELHTTPQMEYWEDCAVN